MAGYEYRVAEVPAHILGQRGGQGEAARLLKDIIDEQAREGFEFYRVDTFTTTRPTGCLSFGGPETVTYNLVTFRRQKPDPAQERMKLVEQAKRLDVANAEQMNMRELRREIAKVRRERSR